MRRVDGEDSGDILNPYPRRESMRELLRAPFLVVLAVAMLLLTWRLGAIYLWQDEATTAVLAERLFTYGRPLAYDGKNLITMDSFADEDATTIDQRTGDVDAALLYFVARKDFKPDSTWIGQPWGQFVAAGLSMSLFGHSTVAARLPFALAAVATVGMLYLLARRVFASEFVALLSVLLLLMNTPWIAHSRQCRYYALSSFALVATVCAFVRWQRGRRFGAPLFVLAAWVYFQCDFGSFFPSMAVLGLIALVSRWPQIVPTLVTLAVLGSAIAPFAWYYEILGRVRAPVGTWTTRFTMNLFNLNQHVIAAPVLALGLWMLWRHRAALDAIQRQVLAAALGITTALILWVPAVAPLSFHRYIVQATPLAALLAAWTAGTLISLLVPNARSLRARGALYASAGLLLAGTGLFSAPLAMALGRPLSAAAVLTSPKIPPLVREIFASRPDPNRMVIEALLPRLAPNDEILVNYEDTPFMFYTKARIRGGIPAFRVEDRTAPPARFLVVRRSVPFVHWNVFEREIARHTWRPIETGAPDVLFGNNPDPAWWPAPSSRRLVTVAERRPEAPASPR